MKTILLAFLCVALSTFHKAAAQPCDLASVQFESVYTGADGKCYADVYFDMDRNNGNKFIYLHFWTKENFNKVNKERFTRGSGPGYADINGTVANPHPSLATVGVDNNDYTAPVWNQYNYRPDAAVPAVKGASVQVSATPVSSSGPKALYRYTIRAIPLGNAGSCSAANIGVIMWSTQANSINSHIHCSLIGPARQQTLNITGSASCATAKYTIRVTNTSNQAVTCNMDVYADNGIRPNNGMFDPATDIKFDATPMFVLLPNQTLEISRSIPASYLGYNLFAQIMLSNNSSLVQQIATSICGTLPTKLQLFTASRNKQQVTVKWQTATEQNVRGFNIHRQTGSGEWTKIAFVPSQAAGGFSSTVLNYQYADQNKNTGISQYRLEEVSADGSTGVSEIKTVAGEETASALSLFPNPSFNGKALLVFSNSSVKNILVFDMSGRVVKQLKNITATTVIVENLKSGFYSIQVIDCLTNETVMGKLLVK